MSNPLTHGMPTREQFDAFREHLRAKGEYGHDPYGPGVYAVRCGDFVKIGCARNITRRVSEIQISNPQPVELIAILSNDPSDERKFHRQFAEYHARGEWFRLKGELLAVIQSFGGARP